MSRNVPIDRRHWTWSRHGNRQIFGDIRHSAGERLGGGERGARPVHVARPTGHGGRERHRGIPSGNLGGDRGCDDVFQWSALDGGGGGDDGVMGPRHRLHGGLHRGRKCHIQRSSRRRRRRVLWWSDGILIEYQSRGGGRLPSDRTDGLSSLSHVGSRQSSFFDGETRGDIMKDDFVRHRNESRSARRRRHGGGSGGRLSGPQHHHRIGGLRWARWGDGLEINRHRDRYRGLRWRLRGGIDGKRFHRRRRRRRRDRSRFECRRGFRRGGHGFGGWRRRDGRGGVHADSTDKQWHGDGPERREGRRAERCDPVAVRCRSWDLEGDAGVRGFIGGEGLRFAGHVVLRVAVAGVDHSERVCGEVFLGGGDVSDHHGGDFLVTGQFGGDGGDGGDRFRGLGEVGEGGGFGRGGLDVVDDHLVNLGAKVRERVDGEIVGDGARGAAVAAPAGEADRLPARVVADVAGRG